MTKAYVAAVRFLSRREYGQKELLNKLLAKYAPAEARAAVEKCVELDLQNDARFAESFCRMRMRQGYGPVRIQQELQSKQIDTALIEAALAQEDHNWLDCALEVWRKKEKMVSGDQDFAVLQKRKAFLLYRGFPVSLVKQVVDLVQCI